MEELSANQDTTDSPPQKSTNTSEDQKLRVPKFLRKLHEIVQDPAFQDYIEWTPDGKSVLIKNSENFAKHVLPAFFKHKSFPSFIRQGILLNAQLNMYNFKKQKFDDMDGCIFSHPFFQRGDKVLIEKIKRKNPNRAKIINSKFQGQKAPEASVRNIQKTTNEQTDVKTDLAEAVKKIESLEKRVDDLVLANHRLVSLIEKIETSIITPQFISMTNTALTGNIRDLHQSVNLSNLTNSNYQLLYFPQKNFM